MARPQKNNCEYFPHLTTMRNHRKVKALRNKFGSVKGYAFWSMFLEYLTELDGNEFEFSSMECEMFAAELGVSAAEIPPMIDYCVEIELLFKTNLNFIYSESLNEYLKPVYDKRGREREKSKSRQRHENGVFASENYTTDGVSAAEIPQSKVEETKEENNTIYRKFAHLHITVSEFDKLIKAGFSKSQIDETIDSVQNYKGNNKYTSLYLTVKKWLKKETPAAAPVTQPQSEFDFDSLNTQRLAAVQNPHLKSIA